MDILYRTNLFDCIDILSALTSASTDGSFRTRWIYVILEHSIMSWKQLIILLVVNQIYGYIGAAIFYYIEGNHERKVLANTKESVQFFLGMSFIRA